VLVTTIAAPSEPSATLSSKVTSTSSPRHKGQCSIVDLLRQCNDLDRAVETDRELTALIDRLAPELGGLEKNTTLEVDLEPTVMSGGACGRFPRSSGGPGAVSEGLRTRVREAGLGGPATTPLVLDGLHSCPRLDDVVGLRGRKLRGT
jgi:hypothetical protein